MNNYLNPIKEYIPTEAAELLYHIIGQYPLKIIITRPRSTKRGDYWPPVRHGFHKISVNGNLNQYSFLFTLLHEIAHMKCWVRFENNIAAHGAEWKQAFRELLIQFINISVFPYEIEAAIKKHIIDKPAYSGNYKIKLEAAFELFDPAPKLRLKDLSDNDAFEISSGRQFRIIKKVRTRYLCTDLINGKQYLISSMSVVKRKF